MKIEREHIEVGSATIYYQVAGAGEPVVLVHGLSGSTKWWAKNIEALARHFRVHLIDLIGFGGSQGRSRFVLSEAAGVLAEWMDQIGIEPANVVGHSMGGYISAELAADFPGRVDRLVLVDAAGLPFGYNYPKHAFGLLRVLRHLPFDFWPVLVQDAYRAGPVTILDALRQILFSDLRVKLAQIEVPALVVWGEHDTVIPVAVGETLSHSLPHAEFIVLDGAGHNPMWDRPLAFNRALLHFLTEGRQDGDATADLSQHPQRAPHAGAPTPSQA
ncbi:MAG: alpha/beta fold hydrolase [Chloroflexota bacterium]|nr:alpha/beta fold hydrolase [Chloroflexota bacterium]